VTQPELSRTVRTDTIGVEPRAVEVTADEAERAALAKRFELGAIGRLHAQVSVVRAGDDIVATGRLQAEVTQSCVVTAEPVAARIDETFAVRFRPEPAAGTPEEEMELGEEEMDVIFHDGALVDVGEAVAQTLALNIDPFPRSPAAVDALREAGVKDELAAAAEAPVEEGPFGALAALKDKLGGG
jgi:uncharacterized metal-binding protein YceD (DUF177 family)